MKRTLIFCIAAVLAISGGLLSGQTVPAIQFDANASPLTMPDNIHLGEVAGVATNSRGEIYVYTRTGNPTITIGTARAVSHGGGRLFQKENKTGDRLRTVMAALSGKYGGATPDQLCYAWILAHPTVPLVVTGTNKIDRLRSLALGASLVLEREDWYAITEAARGSSIP